MKIGLSVLVAAGVLLTAPVGCALLQPTAPVQAAEVSAALAQVDALLTELHDPATTQASPGKDAEIAAMTKTLERLRADLQSASTTQAQQQAALKAAQDAAVTFGGQYGGLIAAGLGILSVLLQGLANSRQAHETAQALAGKLPPASQGRA
jgi:hypothetical protein